MKVFKENDIIAWTYNGHRAVGVVESSSKECTRISVAVDYFVDSNVRDGDLWHSDTVYCDAMGEPSIAPSIATKAEITKLVFGLIKSEKCVSKLYSDSVNENLKLRAENERLQDRNIIQRIFNL